MFDNLTKKLRIYRSISLSVLSLSFMAACGGGGENSTSDNISPIISIIGSESLTIEFGSAYNNNDALQLVTATDNVDGDISSNIQVSGDVVDTNSVGTYLVTLNVSDAAGNAATPVNISINVVDTTAPVITLNDDNILDLEFGSAFRNNDVLRLVSATDNVDGDISPNIQVSGDVVDTNTVGTYVVTLNVSDAAGNAATAVNISINVVDSTAPVISLIGESNIDIYQGEIYTELSANANDNVDGDISSDIQVGGDIVDTDIIGTYIVSYNVSDESGNASTEVTRAVNILPAFRVSNTSELRNALNEAASNGLDDVIILESGTYKTSDDGEGTFVYLSNEANSLSIKGSNNENATLSGDDLHQVLNYQSTNDSSLLTLEYINFIDGNNASGNGGAVFSRNSIKVNYCNILGNSASDFGGGIYTSSSLYVSYSIFEDNNANQYYGGGSYSEGIEIINSTYKNNYSALQGGGVYNSWEFKIINSKFINNSSAYGAGVYNQNQRTEKLIANSIFEGNVAVNEGGALDINARNATIANVLFIGNSSGIQSAFDISIYNSIFIDNGIDLENRWSTEVIANIHNSYINEDNIATPYIGENIIYANSSLGFIDQENGDYRLTSSSDLINVGTSEISEFQFPETDLDGNARIVGEAIDIGPYERQ
ncbi:MAG: DUF5011 domain-containing protein [Pseudoalteromonas sp.]|nr:DUF5011 domain-containing protein [Pseudoalteromonas sp.]